MKKLLCSIVLLCSIGFAYPLAAFEFKAAEELQITEVINDDLYSAGGRNEISAEVNGDVFGAGGDVIIDAKVAQDANIAGGGVVISKEIGDDLRIVGGDITVEADVKGDLFIFGGDVRIRPEVTIHGDMLLLAGNVKMEGTLLGDLVAKAGRLSLPGTVKGNADIEVDSFAASGSGAIEGNLKYQNHEKIEKLEEVTKGEIQFEVIEMDYDDTWKDKILGFALGYFFVKVLGVFIFSSLLYFYFENLFKRAATNLRTMPMKSALYGFLLIVGMPIAAILLMITVIGIPFGLLTLVLFIFTLVFAKLFNVMVMTAFVENKYSLESVWKKLLVIFGFTLLFCLVSIVSIITASFVLGALLMLKVEVIEEIRKQK